KKIVGPETVRGIFSSPQHGRIVDRGQTEPGRKPASTHPGEDKISAVGRISLRCVGAVVNANIFGERDRVGGAVCDVGAPGLRIHAVDARKGSPVLVVEERSYVVARVDLAVTAATAEVVGSP